MTIPTVKKGTKVLLVTAKGESIDAKIVSDGADDNGLVDLSVNDDKYGKFNITRSPFDPTGTQPDSWHTVPAAPQPKPAQPPTPATPEAGRIPETPTK